MALGWVNLNDISFNCFLMAERFQIRLMCKEREETRYHLGIALKYNPAVGWYFSHRCPERADYVRSVTEGAPDNLGAKEVRASELWVMERAEDFVAYTRPEQMAEGCDFIRGWRKERLLELADFTDKVVLDVGSGSGRLTFAAATVAREVYSSEPVGTLREFLREKVTCEGITNVRVVDGMADSLPYPDNSFDIVMSGHVVGDDYDGEIAELTRVCRPGGWIIDCPGEAAHKDKPDEEARKRGWEEFYYVSVHGGDVYRYRKQVKK